MPRIPFEEQVESAIAVLSEFFPVKTYLYFPLLSAALKWAIGRTQEWKDMIFSWEVFPDPGYVQIKSDDFVLNFFMEHPDLKTAYQREIKEKNIEGLRRAFNRLYPIFGLEDPFLTALFFDELELQDFRKIEDEFEQRVEQAKSDVDSLTDKSRLLEGLETFGKEMKAFSVDALSQSEIQKMLREIIKREVEKSDNE